MGDVVHESAFYSTPPERSVCENLSEKSIICGRKFCREEKIGDQSQTLK